MDKRKLNEVTSTSLDVRDDLVKRLLSVVPEAETDGKIDWDKLKQVLTGVIDESPERYNFTWNGKKQAMKLAQLPSAATLKPNKEKSKNWDATENLYIEGDNLEVLKLLQKSYANKIKLIYIDPPYNTGKDFVYKDNYRDTLQNYLEQTGQVDSEGNKLSVNTDTSGRYHTDWLNMMYPRLKLARNLLTDDGVIFISIDENEYRNLRVICDEIFGENNFVGDVIRKTKSMTNDTNSGVNNQHEYLLIYSKNSGLLNLVGEDKDLSNYSNPDDDINGLWCSSDPSAKSGGKSTYFEIENPVTKTIDFPPQGRYWAFSKETLLKYIESGRIKFKDKIKNGERGFIFKRYANDLKTMNMPLNSLFSISNEYMNQRATKDLHELLGKSYFQYPKPIEFLKTLVKASNDRSAIVLDFFSGSSTTADAVMRLNVEDGGNRKFIMVQLPEQLSEKDVAYADGYRTIPEIAQERIRRAGDKIVDENPLFASKLDIGFKVFELDKSNVKKWNVDSTNLIDQIEMLQDNFEPGSTSLDVVYEIMLKQGLSLTSNIIEEQVGASVVYIIENGAMFIVLGDKINSSVANYIVDKINGFDVESSVVVFQDQQFESDSEKLNAIEILNENGITYDNILSI